MTAEEPEGGKRDDDTESEEVDPGRTGPFGWVSLVIIATLVVGTWLLIERLTADAKMQDCVQSGRRNCAPIEDPGK